MLMTLNERIQLRETREFKQSNSLWNKLKLNNKRSIGCLMYLIKKSKAKTLEEWSEYYFKTGLIRKKLTKEYLLKEEFNKINAEYGRTIDDLMLIAKEFKKYFNQPLNIIFNYVYIRVIDETWIGYSRELSAFNEIKSILKEGYSVKDVDYEKDIAYAVDFEIFKNDELIIGIQLKSTKYKEANNGILIQTKNMNHRKNDLYKESYNIDVLYLYIDSNNKIENLDDLIKLMK